MCPAGHALAQTLALVKQRGPCQVEACQDPLALTDSCGDLKTLDYLSSDLFCTDASEFACDRKPEFRARRPISQTGGAKCSGVPHVRQMFNWDCGLACVLMVLRAAAPRTAGMDLATLRQFCPTTSIWTIDLAHLLRRFGMEVVFLTITLGTNPEFNSEAFYAENMPEDEARVQQLFNDAPLAGIPVHKCSLAGEELKEALGSGRYLAILLVDKAKLGGPWPWSSDIALQLSFQGAEPAYTGHYIVVCGYSADTDRYVIRDPAADVEHLTIAADVLESARRAFGTDEDLLLVSTPAPSGGFPAPGVDWARLTARAASF